MARCQAQATFRHQIGVWIVRRGEVRVDRVHHGLILVRSGDREHFGMRFLDHVRFGAKTACNDNLAIRFNRFTDSLKALITRGIQKSARVHQNQVCAGIVRGDLVAFCAQARDDPLGIDQGFRAAEGNDADLGGLGRPDRSRGKGCRGHSRPAITNAANWKGRAHIGPFFFGYQTLSLTRANFQQMFDTRKCRSRNLGTGS